MQLARKSEYLKDLSPTARKRYTEKLILAGLDVDPYCLPEEEWERDPCHVPAVDWSDIALYMILTPSPYTRETTNIRKHF